MRLLNIMLSKVKGGDSTMALRYHEALTAEGYEVLTVGHPDCGLSEALPVEQFAPLVTRYVHDLYAAITLGGYMRDFKPALVLAHGNRAGRLCALPFIGTRGKTVQVLHTPSFKKHLKGVTAALCVSEGVKTGAQQAFPGLKVFEMANFSHLQTYPIKDAPQVRPVIGAMGRLHEIKGFDILIRAAAQLRDSGQTFQLKIAGDGPERGALEALRDNLNLTQHVEFCGWAANPLEFLSGLDLFVVPSRAESFGLVVVEAMAAGVPVVASDTEGPKEVLKAGQFGTLFKSEDVAALANAMRSVFGDWSHGQNQVRAGQAHALNAFGFDAGRRRLRDAIEALV